MSHFVINSIDVDSWLDGDNNTNRNYGSATTTTTTASERIYSGRSSPTKQFQPLSSADARRKALGSGVSDDRANNNQWAEQTDDFFDSWQNIVEYRFCYMYFLKLEYFRMGILSLFFWFV